jgi:hypothetical protein
MPFFKESTYIDEELRQQLNMVLETENTEKLIYFYEVQNQFKKFDVREVRK